MTKADYQEMLRDNICTVIFEKADHSLRTMQCTLKRDTIAEMGLEPNGRGGPVPDDQVRCIDVEKGEWRSFKVDNVVSFAFPVDLFSD